MGKSVTAYKGFRLERQPWRRFQIRAPKWFRRIRNRRLRGIQNRETRRDGEIRTPFKQDAGYTYW